VKGNLRRDEINTLWNLDPYIQASWQFLPQWHLDAGLRYSNVNYESEDHYITAGNGDDSGSTDYQKLLPTVALGWEILPELYAYTSYGKGFETPTFTEMGCLLLLYFILKLKMTLFLTMPMVGVAHFAMQTKPYVKA